MALKATSVLPIRSKRRKCAIAKGGKNDSQVPKPTSPHMSLSIGLVLLHYFIKEELEEAIE
jgi:hypothetical protein